jgi:hypothetical protein
VTTEGVTGAPGAPTPEHVTLRVVCAYAAAFVAFGLFVDGRVRVLHGLGQIVTTRDALLTDYFGIGGIGAGCVNAGVLTRGALLNGQGNSKAWQAQPRKLPGMSYARSIGSPVIA